MTKLEQVEKLTKRPSPGKKYWNSPRAKQRGERGFKQYLLSFYPTEEKICPPCCGMEEKSPCLLARGIFAANRHGCEEKHKPRTLLLGFCHYYVPGWINPLQPNNFCSVPQPTRPQWHPCKCLLHTSSPKQCNSNYSYNALCPITQIEPNEFVSAWKNIIYRMGNGAPARPPCPMLGPTPMVN